MDPYFTPQRRRRSGIEEAAETPLFAGLTLPHSGEKSGSVPLSPARPVASASKPVTSPVQPQAPSKSGGDRVRIYAWIRRRGLNGATRKEIAAAMGIPENSVNPRVRELLVAGAVKPWGEREGCEVVAAAEMP